MEFAQGIEELVLVVDSDEGGNGWKWVGMGVTASGEWW